MKIQRFEELPIWQKSKILAKEIYGVTNSWKDFSFRDQIRRAVISISSNIAEGFERGSNKEFIQFLFIAKGSLGELRSQLFIAQDVGFIEKERNKYLIELCEELSMHIMQFLKYLRASSISQSRYKTKIIIAIFSIFQFFNFSISYAANVDANYKHAWGENIGWVDFSQTHVDTNELSGYAWNENAGWISFNCDNTNSCATVNYAVTNTSAGVLGGYGWSENLGWISFSCSNTNSCSTVDYGVGIDSQGKFAGLAWAENAGWISFSCSNTLSCGSIDYKVITSWRYPGSSTGGGGGIGSFPAASGGGTSVVTSTFISTSTLISTSSFPAISTKPPVSPPIKKPIIKKRGSKTQFGEGIKKTIEKTFSLIVPEEPKKNILTTGTLFVTFENNTLSPIETDHGGGWQAAKGEAQSGSYSAQSIFTGGKTENILSLRHSLLQNGLISFSFFVQSPSGDDRLEFYIDDALIQKWSGNMRGWQNVSFTAPQGTHTYTWKHVRKNTSILGGIIFLDDVFIREFSALSATSGQRTFFISAHISRVDVTSRMLSGQSRIIRAFPLREVALQVHPDRTKDIQRVSAILYGQKQTRTNSAAYAASQVALSSFDFIDTEGDGIYTANFQAPSGIGTYMLVVTVQYLSGTPLQETVWVKVEKEGLVYEKLWFNTKPIEGVSVQLFTYNAQLKSYVPWKAEDFSQKNPITTNRTGLFSFIVPAGTYYIKASANGFQPFISKALSMQDGDLMNTPIRLYPKNMWSLPFLLFQSLLNKASIIILILLALFFFLFLLLKRRMEKEEEEIEQEELKLHQK